ncbi:Transcription factor MYB23 [Entamoeba marina]
MNLSDNHHFRVVSDTLSPDDISLSLTNKVIRNTPTYILDNSSVASYFNSNSKKKYSHSWTQQEDLFLEKAVEIYGARNWRLIAEMVPNRTRKQCRERYCNHLDPSINKTIWTSEEDAILAELHQQVGNKWSYIKKYLPGRTANTIKNRFGYEFQKDINLEHSAFEAVDKTMFEVIY